MIEPMITTLKRILFLAGIVLAAAAFLATAAELAAHALDPELGFFAGFDAVWRTVSPDTHQAWIAAAPDLLRAALQLPGWLVLGAPALVLIILFHERGEGGDEHSLYLFDELSEQARAEGYTDTGDDIQPSDYADFVPADDHYAREDVADDVMPDRDFLLGGAAAPHEAEATESPDEAPSRERESDNEEEAGKGGSGA